MAHKNASSLLKKNRALWERCYKEEAPLLPKTINNPLKLIPASKGELEEWLSNIPLQDHQLLIVYGVGMGEYYGVLKEWLGKNQHHRLIFFENLAPFLISFFTSPLAREILEHEQIRLYYLPTLFLQNQKLMQLSTIYPLHKVYGAAETSHLYGDPKGCQNLGSSIDLFWNMNKTITQEFIYGGAGLMYNLYPNLFELQHSRNSGDLKDQFKGTPAIISGAGPSLGKNRALLKELKNKALLISGGTAINALNAGDIDPHICVGIDPNHSCYDRITTITSWQTPFLYYYRMFHPALSYVHGDKLLVDLNFPISISPWFHSKLNVCAPEPLTNDPLNVLNLCTIIAINLGCNPIIFVGLDLAYSDNSGYAPGVVTGSVGHIFVNFKTKLDSEEVITCLDIFGKPIQTLSKWALESRWYSNLPRLHPEITFINATEGGLGFQGIPNTSLKTVQKEVLKKDYDLETRLHASIQSCRPVFRGDNSEICAALEELKESAQRCQEVLTDEATALTTTTLPLQKKWQQEELPCRAALSEEPIFKCLLSTLDNYHSCSFHHHFSHINAIPIATEKRDRIKMEMHRDRYLHLMTTAKQQRDFISKTLEGHLKHSSTLPQPYKLEQSSCDYVCVDGKVIIDEPSLKLHCADKQPRELKLHSFSEGSTGSTTKSYYTQEGQLHGPSKSYGPNGELLASTWYFDGKKQGRAYRYWNSGKVYASLAYSHDQLNGNAIYLYEDGSLRSFLPYLHGLFHGTISLYYANGRLHRQAHYIEGVKDGSEQLWTESGLPISETYYKKGLPVGTARQWYPKGQLKRLKEYSEDSELLLDESWDLEGNLISTHPVTGDDLYLNEISKQILLLKNSLMDLSNDFEVIGNLLKKAHPEDAIVKAMAEYERDYTTLKKNITRVDALTELLDTTRKMCAEDTGETLWDKSTFFTSVEKEKTTLINELGQHINDLQKWLKSKDQ